MFQFNLHDWLPVHLNKYIEALDSWVMTLYIDVGYQCFGGSCCFHLHFTLKTEVAWSSETMVSYHYYLVSQPARPGLESSSLQKPQVSNMAFLLK